MPSWPRGPDVTDHAAMLHSLISRLWRDVFSILPLSHVCPTSSVFFSLSTWWILIWLNFPNLSLLMYESLCLLMIRSFCVMFPMYLLSRAETNIVCGPANCPRVCLMFWAAVIWAAECFNSQHKLTCPRLGLRQTGTKERDATLWHGPRSIW